MSPTEAKPSQLPITVNGREDKASNGQPTPPQSPVDSKSPGMPPSPGMASLSLSQSGSSTSSTTKSSDIHGLIQTLSSLSKYSAAIGGLETLSDTCRLARDERDIHMRTTARLQAEKDDLQQQLDAHQRKLVASKAKVAAAVKELKDKAAGLERDVQARDARLAESSKELRKARDDVAAAEKKYTEAKTRVEVHRRAESVACDAQKAAEKKFDKLQHATAVDRAKIDKSAAELETMRAYYLPTKAMAVADIARVIDGIAEAAYDAVYACFAHDLPEELFARTEPEQKDTKATAAWGTFVSAMQSCAAGIPLPASNSPAAKTMRIVAIMRYLGIVASTELFQPVYLGDQGDELGVMLARVKDPKLADAARLVLLQAMVSANEGAGEDEEDEEDEGEEDSEEDDDDDDAVPPSRARAKVVADDVLELVGPLLLPAQRETFCTALFQWSFKTAQTWEEELQPLDQRIVVHAPDALGDCADRCTLLVYPGSLSSSSSSSAARTGSFSGTRPNVVRRASLSVVSSSPPSLPSLARPAPPPPKAVLTASAPVVPDALVEVAFGIWPAFTLADTHDTVVKRGLVVSKSQIVPAAEEVAYACAPRRIRRRHERSTAMRPRRQSVSFLDAGRA